MRTLPILVLAPALWLAGCQATGCCADPQAVVAETAGANAEVTRLTLHCVQDDGSTKVCASTDSARVGNASDDEDLRAMQSGETIVLEEGDAIDVTIPLLQTEGKWTTVCGVTVQGMGKDEAVARAKVIAEAVKTALGGTCCNGGDCCSK